MPCPAHLPMQKLAGTSLVYVSALGLLQFDYCLFCYVVSSISSPFRRLYQADHTAEGKAKPQHRELHALLFSTSVWDL